MAKTVQRPLRAKTAPQIASAATAKTVTLTDPLPPRRAFRSAQLAVPLIQTLHRGGHPVIAGMAPQPAPRLIHGRFYPG